MGLNNISCFKVVVICILLNCYVEAGISKIGNKNAIEELEKSPSKIKQDLNKTSTALTTTGTTTINFETTNEEKSSTNEVKSSTNLKPEEEKIKLDNDFKSTTPMNNDIPLTTSSSKAVDETTLSTELYRSTTLSYISSTVKSSPATKSPPQEDDKSCICGIFLSSQFVKGSTEQPNGEPAISNTLIPTFQCNPIGQRQCQTKCLEQIVQHLPNSANILCASLGRDIHRERAYLFIKNCSNQWYNTNLAAGREYCCKSGQPYKCSMK